MAPAGLAAVARARANGSWQVLDSAERLEVPGDLAAVLDAHPAGCRELHGLPRGDSQQLLGWGAVAVRPATRAARVARVAEASARNDRSPTPRG